MNKPKGVLNTIIFLVTFAATCYVLYAQITGSDVMWTPTFDICLAVFVSGCFIMFVVWPSQDKKKKQEENSKRLQELGPKIDSDEISSMPMAELEEFSDRTRFNQDYESLRAKCNSEINKRNAAEKEAKAPYKMETWPDLDALIFEFKRKKVSGLTSSQLERLVALTDQSHNEKVDKDIYEIHAACEEEQAKRRFGTSASQVKPETAIKQDKGYAPANPTARLNRAALDPTPDKVRKAQRKAGLRCPKCGSTNVTLLNNTKSSLSAGKAVVGDLVAGAPGMVVGAAMGKKGKREYLCNNCGKRYSVKN